MGIILIPMLNSWQMPLQVYLMINLQLMMFNFYHVELLRLTK